MSHGSANNIFFFRYLTAEEESKAKSQLKAGTDRLKLHEMDLNTYSHKGFIDFGFANGISFVFNSNPDMSRQDGQNIINEYFRKHGYGDSVNIVRNKEQTGYGDCTQRLARSMGYTGSPKRLRGSIIVVYMSLSEAHFPEPGRGFVKKTKDQQQNRKGSSRRLEELSRTQGHASGSSPGNNDKLEENLKMRVLFIARMHDCDKIPYLFSEIESRIIPKNREEALVQFYQEGRVPDDLGELCISPDNLLHFDPTGQQISFNIAPFMTIEIAAPKGRPIDFEVLLRDGNIDLKNVHWCVGLLSYDSDPSKPGSSGSQPETVTDTDKNDELEDWGDEMRIRNPNEDDEHDSDGESAFYLSDDEEGREGTSRFFDDTGAMATELILCRVGSDTHRNKIYAAPVYQLVPPSIGRQVHRFFVSENMRYVVPTSDIKMLQRGQGGQLGHDPERAERAERAFNESSFGQLLAKVERAQVLNTETVKHKEFTSVVGVTASLIAYLGIREAKDRFYKNSTITLEVSTTEGPDHYDTVAKLVRIPHEVLNLSRKVCVEVKKLSKLNLKVHDLEDQLRRIAPNKFKASPMEFLANQDGNNVQVAIRKLVENFDGWKPTSVIVLQFQGTFRIRYNDTGKRKNIEVHKNEHVGDFGGDFGGQHAAEDVNQMTKRIKMTASEDDETKEETVKSFEDIKHLEIAASGITNVFDHHSSDKRYRIEVTFPGISGEYGTAELSTHESYMYDFSVATRPVVLQNSDSLIHKFLGLISPWCCQDITEIERHYQEDRRCNNVADHLPARAIHQILRPPIHSPSRRCDGNEIKHSPVQRFNEIQDFTASLQEVHYREAPRCDDDDDDHHHHHHHHHYDPPAFEELQGYYLHNPFQNLDQSQANAVKSYASRSVNGTVGYPGTGKTWTIAELLSQVFRKYSVTLTEADFARLPAMMKAPKFLATGVTNVSVDHLVLRILRSLNDVITSCKNSESRVLKAAANVLRDVQVLRPVSQAWWNRREKDMDPEVQKHSLEYFLYDAPLDHSFITKIMESLDKNPKKKFRNNLIRLNMELRNNSVNAPQLPHVNLTPEQLYKKRCTAAICL